MLKALALLGNVSSETLELIKSGEVKGLQAILDSFCKNSANHLKLG